MDDIIRVKNGTVALGLLLSVGAKGDGADTTALTSRVTTLETLVAAITTYSETIETAPAGSVFCRPCVSGTWPVRGSSRTDIVVAWLSRTSGDPTPPQGGSYAIGDDFWLKIDA